MNDLCKLSLWLRDGGPLDGDDAERMADVLALRIDAARHAVHDLDCVLNDPGSSLAPESRTRLEGLQAALAGPRGDTP
ncbi:hypothetical protein [Paraburkholderia sp. JHI869]|uniref:hypothetical protein n=1 Tax=Paraburkholderia sp. JHI869 TaxID=3112959 RepID=UPI003170FCD8